MVTTTDTDPLEDRLWDAIFEARDLPGKTGEASTMSIVEAILPIIAAEVQAAKAEAWDECAGMAAHHGAFDGGRARWLSSINPHQEEGAGHDD